MRQIFFFVMMAITVVFMSFSAQAAFVEGLEDIPLPEGLEQVENGNLSFGNEEIRLIEVYLTSTNLTFAGIRHFYQETLPQMGWQIKQQEQKKILFEREGETLEISKESTQPLIVRLTVKSKL